MADLLHLGKRAGRERVADLLERFDLVDAAGRMAVTYSGGMRRRLDLAMTLVGRPRIIFLDEPTTGLDPRSRHTMWQSVRELVSAGTTIFLTTQYLDEADQLSDRIAVLNGGRLVAEGTPPELKRLVPGGHVRLQFSDPARLEHAAARFADGTRDDDALTLDVPGDGGVATLRTLLDRLTRERVEPDGLSVHTPVRTLISVVLVVLVALALGFRPSATPLEYLAALGVFAMLTFALTWLAVAFGLATKTVAGANSLSLILQFLPLISSAFLPTDSMPAGVAWFAEHQPYTPIIETLRGLLMGSGIGDSALWSVGWCVVLAAAGFVWSRALYNRPRRA
jgi:hypothetical protein